MSNVITRLRDALATVGAAGSKDAAGPIYHRLVSCLRESVEDGSVLIGTRLPSERQMADALSISRTTVQNAYRTLESQGYIETRRGSGTFVCARPEWAVNAASRQKRNYARNVSATSNTFLLDLMQAATETHRYSFETGMPDPMLLPTAEFESIIADLFSRRSGEWISYSPTQGVPRFRYALTQSLLTLRGLAHVPSDQVLVLTGSMQGIDLVSRLLLNPGDSVLVENPTFPGAIQIFRSYGAKLVGVPVDRDGIVIDAMEELLERHRPKLLYLQTALQNPTGATLSRRRRTRLLELVGRYQVPVLEDDAYGLLQDAPEARPLKADDPDNLVIYLGTLSKIVSPGLRVGYLVAEEGIVRDLAQIKQLTDLHTSTISQYLVEGWLSTGDVRGHLQRCRNTYRERVNLALRILQGNGKLRPYVEPTGGFYLFCGLPAPLTSAKLRAHSVHRSVIFASGDAFTIDGSLAGHLRLCVSSTDLPTIRVGLERMLRLVEELSVSAS